MQEKKPKVCIPVLAYNGQVNGNYMICLLNLALMLLEAKYDVNIRPYYFESLIPRGRNGAACNFLSSGADILLFIDCDIIFDAKDAMRLINSPYEICGAAYPKKYLKPTNSEYPVDFTINGTITLTDTPNVYTGQYLPTGFLCIKRTAFEKIISQKPEIAYTNNIDGYMTDDNPQNRFYNLFPCPIEPEHGHMLSEDYGFCQLATQCGIPLHCFADIQLGHNGNYVYTGNLADFIKTTPTK